MAVLSVQPAPVEHAGHLVPLLAVYIDGKLVSNEFPPFDASAPSVCTSTCLECFVSTGGKMTTCGSLPDGLESHDDIGIRRHGNLIYWFHLHTQRHRMVNSGTLTQHASEFQIDNYERELGGDSSVLPKFSIEDILRILNFGVRFSPAEGLFTIPGNENDPQGRKLLQLIDDISMSEETRICETPVDSTLVRIGIENQGIPECMLRIGRNHGCYTILLESNPAFPFWLTSPLINNRLREITE